jgi:hypothetical protein
MSIFSKNYNLCYVVVGNGARKSRCFLGKNIDFQRGGGINIRFLPKHRPLMFCFIGRQATDSERAGESEVRVPEDQRVEDLSPGHRHG